ncbi:MAG: PaaX family transcriptional regulator C-terminal domain-containing protein [Methylocystaceae bacterium]
MIPTMRPDSVSSILMFIFNIFLTEQGINSIPLKKIFPILSPFGKSETAIRMGLSRAIQSGILSNRRYGGEVYYDLTTIGHQALDEWRQTLVNFHRNINRQQSGWNGLWTLFVINELSPIDAGSTPHAWCPDLPMGRLCKDLWISPYPINAKTGEMPANMLIMEAHLVSGLSHQEIAAQVWPVAELAEQYLDFIQNLEPAAADLLTSEPTALIALPFLHSYGSQLFNLIQADPQLPLEVLPKDWFGIKAYQAFQKIRQNVLPIAAKYISDIISN